MKVLVTGSARGQLYRELLRTCPDGVRLCEFERRLDITDADAVAQAFAEQAPELVINAAAYTAVDRAEQEPEVAAAVNAGGAGMLADAADRHGARMIQVSTDFVFGDGHCAPIAVDAATAPLGVYGETKRAGEWIVQEVLGSRALIVRTAWVYSAGGANFVKTMLRLMNERDTLGVVADQIGSPTWARGLALALWQAAGRDCHGIMHVTGSGVASWYDLAVAVLEEGAALGLISPATDGALTRVSPLCTADYPTPARRPSYSVLDTQGTRLALDIPAVHWREELRQMLRELA